MGAEELTGNYTYRSYRDVPEPVQSFNDLRFAQLALQLAVRPDGTATGTLIFPAPAGVEPPTMDISGRVSAGAPVQVRLTGKGHPGTSTADFHYEYDGVVLHHWETASTSASSSVGPCSAPRTMEAAPPWPGPASRRASSRSGARPDISSGVLRDGG